MLRIPNEAKECKPNIISQRPAKLKVVNIPFPELGIDGFAPHNAHVLVAVIKIWLSHCLTVTATN